MADNEANRFAPAKAIRKCNALFLGKKYEEGIKLSDELIKDYPTDGLAWYYKGSCMGGLSVPNEGARIKNLEEAVKCFDKAIEYASNRWLPYAAKGKILLILGKPDEAIAVLESSVKLKDGSRYDNHFYLGLAYLTKKDDENAKKNLEKAMKLNPKMTLNLYKTEVKGALENIGKLPDTAAPQLKKYLDDIDKKLKQMR